MKIEPDNRDLWNRFQSCERNEMIITKSGRCLFPVLKFNVIIEETDRPLPNHNSTFSYGLGMELVDSYKWKYRDGHWFSLTSNSANSPHSMESSWHVYEPETSPSSWMQILNEGLNFSKVKLTNRKSSSSSLFSSHTTTNNGGYSSSSNYFSLSSFGNYVPVVFLLNWNIFLPNHYKEIPTPVSIDMILRTYDMNELEKEGSLQIIRVYECSFIAVTHYQNVLITHLKKHNNPHAKGFILSDESMGRIPHTLPRGKPGRKSRILESKSTQEPTNESYGHLPYDVYLASKALERMSTLNVPRSEIIKSSENLGFFIDNESSSKEEQEHKILNYYNKLK